MATNGKIGAVAAGALVLATMALWTSNAQADQRRGGNDRNSGWTRNDNHRSNWDRDRGNNWSNSRGNWDRDRGNYRPSYPQYGYYNRPVVVQRPLYYTPPTYYVPRTTYCPPPVYYVPQPVYGGSGIYLNFSFGD